MVWKKNSHLESLCEWLSNTRHASEMCFQFDCLRDRSFCLSPPVFVSLSLQLSVFLSLLKIEDCRKNGPQTALQKWWNDNGAVKTTWPS